MAAHRSACGGLRLFGISAHGPRGRPGRAEAGQGMAGSISHPRPYSTTRHRRHLRTPLILRERFHDDGGGRAPPRPLCMHEGLAPHRRTHAGDFPQRRIIKLGTLCLFFAFCASPCVPRSRRYAQRRVEPREHAGGWAPQGLGRLGVEPCASREAAVGWRRGAALLHGASKADALNSTVPNPPVES